MDNLVPILLYIRNFREYRHRDCRDASPRFLVRESLRQRARNRSSVSTTSTSSPSSSLSATATATPTASTSSSFASSSTVNLISLGRSPSFRYKMQQVGEEIKELEKEASPEVDRSTAINRIDSRQLDHHHHHQHQLQDQDYGDDDDADDDNDDYSKLINLEDEGFPENFQIQIDEASSDIADRYRRALLANTLLDNERHAYSFEGEHLREEFNTLEDDYLHTRRLLRDKTRTCDLLKRDHAKLKDSCVFLEHCINQRDDLFEKNGLSYLQLRPFRSICDIKAVSSCDDNDDDDVDVEDGGTNGDTVDSSYSKPTMPVVLLNDPSNPIDQLVINFFNQYDQSTLEEQLKSLISERIDLLSSAERLRKEVKEKREKNLNLEEKVFTESYRLVKSSDVEALETQQENIRLLKEYRDKLSFTNEEIKRLKEKLSYLEKELDQLKRNHQNSEKSEVTLNKKKRQSLRQLREVEAKIGELEGLNNLLYKKLDKIKKSQYVVS